MSHSATSTLCSTFSVLKLFKFTESSLGSLWYYKYGKENRSFCMKVMITNYHDHGMTGSILQGARY